VMLGNRVAQTLLASLSTAPFREKGHNIVDS